VGERQEQLSCISYFLMIGAFQPRKFFALSEKIEPHSSHSQPNNFPPAVFASSLSKIARMNISTCPQAGQKARSLSEVRAIVFTPVLN